MKSLVIFLLMTSLALAEDATIEWLVEYDGRAMPGDLWTKEGSPEASVENGKLRLRDTASDVGCYRASWDANLDENEIVIEATLRVINTTGAVPNKPDSKTFWPWRDGAPVGLLVSDGRHHEGLVFYTDRVTSWTDRFILADTEKDFHTYRIVIRGHDMSIAVDGEMKVEGHDAFWRPSTSDERFIQFGSNSQRATGDAEWRSVKLGIRKSSSSLRTSSVTIEQSEPWPISRPDLKTKLTRPYLSRIDDKRLMMSIAEGPDAIHEPYGVMLSEDEGRTWKPVKDWDQTELAPLPMIGLKDGSLLGMSRWTWPQPNKTDRGQSVHWNADLSEYTSYESRLYLPQEYRPQATPFTCERHVIQQPDGSLLMAGYSKTGPSTPDGLRSSRRYAHLLRSTDTGKTWNHFSVVGTGGEPAVAATGNHRMTAVLRTGPFKPMVQTFSEDDGQTWSAPRLLEVGSVCPDLVLMSNGLLACSYGRPANCLMFSPDGGRNWTSHHVITDKTGFNYSGIVEVRPGRLLYIHDAGGLQGLYVDVDYKKPTTDYALRTAKELKPTRTIVYKNLPDRKLEMRIFEPEGYKPTDRRPCFLAIHGGGWVAGTPDVVYCVASHFAKQGWLGISLQYRIAKPERGTTVFDAVSDTRSAMRYLRQHASELGIDPERIVAGGRSAGGHLAAAAALCDGIDEVGEDTSISCIPNASIVYSGVLDTSDAGYGKDVIGERWEELSPLHLVRRDLPPMLVLHGIRDTVTPVANAKDFNQAMLAAGNTCELILHERGNHSYMMRTEPLFEEAMTQTRSFIERTLGIPK